MKTMIKVARGLDIQTDSKEEEKNIKKVAKKKKKKQPSEKTEETAAPGPEAVEEVEAEEEDTKDQETKSTKQITQPEKRHSPPILKDDNIDEPKVITDTTEETHKKGEKVIL